MAKFAPTRERKWKCGQARITAAWTGIGTAALFLFSCPGASAQTTGNQGDATGAGEILQLFNRPPYIVQPTSTTTITLVDFSTSFYGYIANPYMGVTVGVSGSYTIAYATNVSIPYNNAGMISFGNRVGSRRFASDDNQPLNSTGLALGDVFPIPSQFEVNSGGFSAYDYPAYLRARVDGTNVNIVQPTFARFENNVLTGTADLGNNVSLRQEITLYRTQARLRWLITNNDTASHTVTLRFNVNQTGAGFYVDPVRGLTNRYSVITGADIPDTLAFYGARYEGDAGNLYSSRHTFRGAGATPPYKVVIANAFELRPSLTNFDVVDPTLTNPTNNVTGAQTSLVRQPGIEAATASYFGPYTLTPGSSAQVITFYGNGTTSDRLDNDFVTDLDGPEALQLNFGAATNSDVAGNTSATIQNQGVEFLAPNPFQVYAGIYNRVPANPTDKVNLTNVSATLTLPTGLAFANVPGTTTADTSLKTLGSSGSVLSDRGADTFWYVRPTGDAFGTLTYQVAINTTELGGRQQTRTISIPAIPYRNVTNTSFQMIGFPFAFDAASTNNADPATVINSLSRPIDEPVAFYQWVPDPNNPGLGAYQIATSLQNGIGYMYRPQLSRTIVAKGVYPEAGQSNLTITSSDSLPQRQVILQPGWNMISNPYVYDAPLRTLRFAIPTSDQLNGANIPNVSSRSFAEAVNSGLLRAGVFTLNTSTRSYDAITDANSPLQPWQAYWIYATNRAILIYPNPTQRQAAVTPGDGTDNPPTRAVATADNWNLQLIAKRGDSVDSATWVGMSNKGETESRRVLPKPPTPLTSYVYTGIVKDEKGARYAKDIRTDRGTQTWNVEVRSDEDGPVTVTWPNVGKLPSRVNLKVKDTKTGRQYSMRSLSSFTVNVTKAQPARLEITSSPGASLPTMISGVRVIKNGTRSSGTREFVFNVTRDVSVSAQVLTVTGKTVATISGRAISRGEGRLPWDGKAQNGTPLPPGPYQLKLEARDGDGNVVPYTQMFISNE